MTALLCEAVDAGLDVAAVKATIEAALDRDYADLDALYKHLHAHPELPFLEVETAARMAEEMRRLGFAVTEGVGGTGVVAVLENGEGPSILVRTELDGLPIRETTGLPYASEAKATWLGEPVSVMHSCGHDVHMAAWVGAARALLDMKDQWRGRLVFIAQPAEETVSGARAMLEDGFIERFGKPDCGFALHVAPIEAGVVAYKAGVLTSNSDTLEVTFNGRGGHGSMPHMTLDPIMMAARFTVDVQSVISREKDPFAFGVVSIGAIHGGSAANVIPACCKLHGTIRTLDAGVREKLLKGIQRTAIAVADMAGAPAPDIDLVPGGKAVINDQAIADRTGAVFQAAFGDKARVIPSPAAASEDYSEFILAGVPSLFFMIGGFDGQKLAQDRRDGRPAPTPHTSDYAPVPEPTIRTGVVAMTLAVLNALARPS